MTAPRRVLVVGGGLTGWSAAAALKRRVPLLDVTILPIAPPANALADRIANTLPSIFGFHDDLGIGLDDAVLRTGSHFRLGTLFRGWAQGLPDYVHAYARHGEPMSGAAFHQLWARAAKAGKIAPFDAFSPAAAMARAERFMLPIGDTGPFSAYGVGLTLDVLRYTAMLSAFARHVGVRVQPGSFSGVALVADGAIDAVALDGDTQVTADLYIDCTGPRALLHTSMPGKREDWRPWLPCDQLVLREGPAAAIDTVTADGTGWHWESAGQSGAVIASAYPHADAGEPITFESGATLEPWRHNVIAIGDAAAMVEPLEWANLHLAHSAIDRLIAMLPAARPHPLEAAEYNRQALAEARRVRDFVILHYATARRDEPFWRDIATTPLPDSLAHSLSLFRERGRLPYYEEETFDRDSWLAVLFGQGVLPRRIDPLADAVPPDEAARAMEMLRGQIARAVATLPTPAAYRAAQSRQFQP